MERLSRVLCAVAIDERDRPVFTYALGLARRNDARLLVVHAPSPEVPFNRGAAERVSFLRSLRAMAEAAGVEVEVSVQQGPVAEIILLHARARRADLIVVGTSGEERRRGLSGWTAERVLREAPCPTLVVPRTLDVPAVFESILCAVDFSPASQAALHAALRLSKLANVPVTLLHVVDEGGSADLYAGQLEEYKYNCGRGGDALARLQSLIPCQGSGTVMARVAVGHPAREIVRAARTMKAPLIVIGATRRTRIGRLFGSTAELLRDAHCPVLAVPPEVASRLEVEHLSGKAA